MRPLFYTIMKNKFLISFFSVLCLVISCQPNDNGKINDTKNTRLKGEKINLPTSSITRVFDMKIIDSLLILSTPTRDHLFQIFDINNLSFLQYFGKKGNGPGELGFPSFIQLDSESPQNIVIFDKNRFSVYESPVSQILDGNLVLNKTVNKYETSVQRMVKLINGSYLSYGIFKHRFALLNEDGIYQKGYLQYPFENEQNDLSFSSLAMAYQGKIETNPQGNRIVMATTQSANVDIVELDTLQDQLKLVKSIHSWMPDFSDQTDGNSIGVAFKTTNTYGYIDLTVNDEFIYLLLSGKQRDPKDRYAHRESNKVVIYDWNGDKHNEIILDKEVNAIEVSPNNNYLISYIDDEPPLFFKYNLH